MNIAMLLEMAAEGDPERIVLGSHEGGITAADLLERARRAAIYFEKSGAEVVGYFGLNTDTLPVALFGAALAGVPFAPLNYRAPDEQLRGIVGRVQGGVHDRRRRGGGAPRRHRRHQRHHQGHVRSGHRRARHRRASLRRPRRGRRAALHERHHVGAQGGDPAPPASRVLHHLERRVPRLRADRGAADLRALVPHRRHRGGVELALRGPSHHVPAVLRGHVVGATGGGRAHHARHGGADHAGADPRRARGGRRRAAGPAPPLLRRRAHAARARRAHPDRHAPHRSGQRLRADGNQFHHRHAHPRRAPRGLRQ